MYKEYILTFIILFVFSSNAFSKKMNDIFNLEERFKIIEALDQTEENKKILKEMFTRAYNGDSLAQFKIGVLYEAEQFFPKNPKEAVKFYKQSADEGNEGAQINLSTFAHENICFA